MDEIKSLFKTAGVGLLLVLILFGCVFGLLSWSAGPSLQKVKEDFAFCNFEYVKIASMPGYKETPYCSLEEKNKAYDSKDEDGNYPVCFWASHDSGEVRLVDICMKSKGYLKIPAMGVDTKYYWSRCSLAAYESCYTPPSMREGFLIGRLGALIEWGLTPIVIGAMHVYFLFK